MQNYYQNEEQILKLVDGFKNKNIPKDKWTHEAHLTVGIWFLKNHGRYEATCLLRSGIVELNVALGGKNTEADGYHETITLLWIWLLDKYLKAHPGKSLIELCNDFLNTEYADRNVLLKYYSKEVLFSTKARAIWVEPDRRLLATPF